MNIVECLINKFANQASKVIVVIMRDKPIWYVRVVLAVPTQSWLFPRQDLTLGTGLLLSWSLKVWYYSREILYLVPPTPLPPDYKHPCTLVLLRNLMLPKTTPSSQPSRLEATPRPRAPMLISISRKFIHLRDPKGAKEGLGVLLNDRTRVRHVRGLELYPEQHQTKQPD